MWQESNTELSGRSKKKKKRKKRRRYLHLGSEVSSIKINLKLKWQKTVQSSGAWQANCSVWEVRLRNARNGIMMQIILINIMYCPINNMYIVAWWCGGYHIYIYIYIWLFSLCHHEVLYIEYIDCNVSEASVVLLYCNSDTWDNGEVCNKSDRWVHVRLGLHQGSTLSPFLHASQAARWNLAGVFMEYRSETTLWSALRVRSTW